MNTRHKQIAGLVCEWPEYNKSKFLFNIIKILDDSLGEFNNGFFHKWIIMLNFKLK